MPFTLRRATPNDAETVRDLILELADYEKLLHEARPDVDALREHLDGSTSLQCEALLAEDDETGAAVGFALFFPNYSTFLTKWGIYLEDLYVKPEHRGQGIGFALLKRVAEIAVERGAERMDWAVLDWNELAIDFYRQLGTTPLDDWTTMRLSDDALREIIE